ncbi:MAG: hypothetical protein A2464_13470 [Deltaproteobacteria bacterium RIFOXYC2_FULL_48_10]|nr:MAG: hypothetical protein A2464_13470 [Deltaproteobacteria bacterium RIFOXYC2_FULL_48_10]
MAVHIKPLYFFIKSRYLNIRSFWMYPVFSQQSNVLSGTEPMQSPYSCRIKFGILYFYQLIILYYGLTLNFNSN